jgi:hypothetical protein
MLSYKSNANKHPTKKKKKTPFKILFKIQPYYNFLKVFGSAYWPNLQPYNVNKLQPWSIQCLFPGYSLLHKGYKCLHIPSSRVYFSRDVIFQEEIFPFSQAEKSPSLSSSSVLILGPTPFQLSLLQLVKSPLVASVQLTATSSTPSFTNITPHMPNSPPTFAHRTSLVPRPANILTGLSMAYQAPTTNTSMTSPSQANHVNDLRVKSTFVSSSVFL